MTITMELHGTRQEINLLDLLAYEQTIFCEYVEKLPSKLSEYQHKKVRKMLQGINKLQSIINNLKGE